MLIIGCDFHTRYQQIAMLDDQTGELIERRRVARSIANHAPDCAAYQIDRRAQNKIRAAYIAFLFFAMCAGFDSGLRALPFLSQKEKEFSRG